MKESGTKGIFIGNTRCRKQIGHLERMVDIGNILDILPALVRMFTGCKKRSLQDLTHIGLTG
jgi:hypothetical protein